jgi:hypothetical protein
VDQTLAASGVTNGFRIIDDYEVGARSFGEAEAAVSALQAALNEYELHLNGAKTAILELPVPHVSPWVPRITSFSLPAPVNKHAHSIVEFFDRAFEQAKLHPEDPVVSFSIRCASRFPLDPTARRCYEQLLLQSTMVEPAALRYVIPELVRLAQAGHALDRQRLEEVLNGAITRHALLGQGSEVAWAITGLMQANLPLSAAATQAAFEMADPVAALCALDAWQRGLLPAAPDLSLFASYMTPEDLFGKQWLLAYEANVKGWLPPAGPTDHVNAEPAFARLKAGGVSFYEPAAVPIPRQALAEEAEHAPEEYGS